MSETSQTKPSIKIQDHFHELTDPRRRKVTYPLINVVVISVCAVICGANDFVGIASWARRKQQWLETFLELESGIPSHDRFNQILAAIKPAQFEKCLLSWITALQEITDGQIVAIDGKTLRGSYDKTSSKSAIHMVSAWASENQISLGQVVADEKSNEITAIPKLLEMLEIEGCLVTIDAMGCQTEIAERIVEKGADYVLAAKGNQPTIHQGIQDYFSKHFETDFADALVRRYETSGQGHGRVEDRWYFVCPVPENLPGRDRWPHLTAIGMAVSRTERNGKECCETRYYLLSQYLSGRRFAEAVRGHWSIENSLHWQLDVTFGEDRSRIRQGNADQNFSILRRTALSLLKNETTEKVGIANKRLIAASDEAYLEKVLTG